jgi:hypothetical protein
MNINSKESLHQVLDEMMERFKREPYEIGLCMSYRKYDDDMYWFGEYKGLLVTFYAEWFAKGKIAIH